MWDRIRKNIEKGLEGVGLTARYVSERARLEVRVSRLLIDKGALELKREKSCRILGERAYTLIEAKADILSDPEISESVREITMLRERIDEVSLKIKKASQGEEDE